MIPAVKHVDLLGIRVEGVNEPVDERFIGEEWGEG